MRLLLIAPKSNAHTEYSRLSAPGSDALVTRIAAASIATVAALALVRLFDERLDRSLAARMGWA